MNFEWRMAYKLRRMLTVSTRQLIEHPKHMLLSSSLRNLKPSYPSKQSKR